MKIFNALTLFQTIPDDALYEAVYDGFMSIYESVISEDAVAEDYFIDHVDNLTYPEAQADLIAYSAGADNLETYKDRIGPIANKIALTQASLGRGEYAKMSEKLDATMDESDFDAFSREMKRIEPIFTGHNSIEDYESEVKPELMQRFVQDIGSVDEFVQYANTFIYYEKLNDLMHKIKHELLARVAKNKQ